MLTLFYFIVAISVLVVIHEYGHFWVARRCGVQVKRFSVGFGKPLFSIKDKHGTEFSIAPIPMGGYVSMLDEREGEVPEHLKNQAFNNKTPWQRIAIASAGPIANFIFAVFAYWAIFVVGTTGLAPVIGAVQEGGAAEQINLQAGDEIIAIGGKLTPTWEDVNWQLVNYIGETTAIPITVQSSTGSQYQVEMPVQQWLAEDEVPSPLFALGIEPRSLHIPAIIGHLAELGAAEQAGLQAGDKVLAVNGQGIQDWYQLVEQIQQSPDQPLQLFIERDAQRFDLTVTPRSQQREDGQVYGYIGAGVQAPNYPEDWLRVRKFGMFESIGLAAEKTWDTTYFTLTSLWKMIAGQLSVKNLSGPVSIAKVAGASAAGGFESFVGFLALLSVSLGVLNLLPIPVLDGGHIVFCLAEIIKGKPLTEKTQMFAVRVGMFLLLSLMIVAFYNDLSRL